jgi:hypothetical protein
MSMVYSGDSIQDTDGGVLRPISSVMRNRIINGQMVLDQRNAGASVTPANTAYTLDRWCPILTQASKFSVQQNAGSVTPPVGFTNYLGITSLSAYSIVAGDIFSMIQVIEGFNTADLAWGTANAKTVTLSFQVRSSLTGTFGGALSNNAQNRTYPFTYSIPVANTWTTISVTIAGDTSGTWLTNNSGGIVVRFGLGVGSTFSGTASAWAGSNFYSATGATSVVGTNGATFYITGVQLEVGTQATSFEYRQYGTELQLCQRYFYVIDSNGLVAGAASSGSRVWSNVAYPVRMRTAPTSSVTGVIQISDNNTADYSATATIVAFQGTSVGSRINLDGFSGLTAGRFYAGYSTGSPSGQLFYSAEL